MSFAEYYRGQFRSDLHGFLMSIPQDSRNHDYDKTVFTIQFDRLTINRPHLLEVREASRGHFAVALFWTILADEVCYTHFRSAYDRFRRLTLYPKFIGDCPGGCGYHLHPSQIFTAINRGRSSASAQRATEEIDRILRESVEVMKAEVVDFCDQHLQEVPSLDFWRRCVAELPLSVKFGSATSDGGA